MNAFSHEDLLVQEIRSRIKAAGECVWQRHPLPWTHPGFKSASVAARNVMRVFNDKPAFLVMRDACLRAVRETVLLRDKVLVIPSRDGDSLLEIPGRALASNPISRIPVLRIDPAPQGSKPYTGALDVVVVGCLAFNPFQRRLYTFELEHTAYILDALRQGLPNGWQLPAVVPVVALAADQQEVQDWPSSAMGLLEADLVITPTRVIVLGNGETVGVTDTKQEVHTE